MINHRAQFWFSLLSLAALILTIIPLPVSADPLLGCTGIKATKFPSEGGCDGDEFVTTVKNVINWLTMAALALAIFFIGWGGFILLVSGGNTERVTKGKKMITIAITGLIILLVSYIIIQLVFQWLGTNLDKKLNPTS